MAVLSVAPDSTDVSTGHASLDLEDWLTEPTSINYRVGYCEQFAATMAAMVALPGSAALVSASSRTNSVSPTGRRWSGPDSR